MAEEDNENQYFTETSTKVRDLEEKQRIIKDRILLVGQNLIEMKEDIHTTFLDIKKDIEIMKRDIERLKSFFEAASGEFSKFARKDDLEILSKQAKMFQPLELVTKKDLEKLKNN
jgi:zona occludens toxin (predicted ATPase)